MGETSRKPSSSSIAYKKRKPSFFQKRKIAMNDYLLDHPALKYFLEYTWAAIGILISAFTFAYGYRAFIAPKPIEVGGSIVNPSLISGGASGTAQIFLRIFQIFGYTGNEYIMTSICFFLVNVPLFYVAWKRIGKRFTILTFIDVVLCSVLISYIPQNWVVIFEIDTDFIARALFAGILTGVSSGIAYVVGCSAGGVDVVAYAIAEKKSTTAGKFAMIINAIIVIVYTLVNIIRLNNLGEVTMTLYTVIYFFTASKVVDIINIKNKKTEIQITTSKTDLAPLLLRAFPHGCSVIDARGGYSGQPRKIIFMIVSDSEVKRVIEFSKKVDSDCFVTIVPSKGVYGKFYIKPIK
ncbi:MAG: YitT family protein [Bacilli bacterium]|nr:YitT family protein [Bacilli bacterium]